MFVNLELYITGAGEDRATARPEGPGIHNGGKSKDGQQAVQLSYENVQ